MRDFWFILLTLLLYGGAYFVVFLLFPLHLVHAVTGRGHVNWQWMEVATALLCSLVGGLSGVWLYYQQHLHRVPLPFEIFACLCIGCFTGAVVGALGWWIVCVLPKN